MLLYECVHNLFVLMRVQEGNDGCSVLDVLDLLSEHGRSYFEEDVRRLEDFISIDQDRTRRLIVRNLVQLAGELPCTLIAEGIETLDEARCLADLGITLHQGYAYARPGFESLPQPDAAMLEKVKAG